MIHRIHSSVALLFCFSFGLLNTGLISSVHAQSEPTKQEQSINAGKINGKITNLIDVTGYTYVEVNTGGKTLWAAGPTTALKIGDIIAFSAGMTMKNFHSKALKRDFSIIYFTDRFTALKGIPLSDSIATSVSGENKPKPFVKPVAVINKIADGNTIAEIHTHKNDLNGKKVRIRGQVTKFTPAVMGKNWIHIRDNSTSDDLTVTTDSKELLMT